MDIELENFKVPEAGQTIYYIPEFISEFEEQNLIKNIENAPKPKWTHLSRRRLQNWGGLPHAKGMIAEPMPEWLTKCVDKITAVGIFPQDKKPNHVLINEYIPGQGIMAHTDGPLFHPIVTTVSCGSHTLLDFYKPRSELDLQAHTETDGCQSFKDPVVSLLLEPRSLVIVEDDMYNKMLHQIAERSVDEIGNTSNIANLSMCSAKFKSGGQFERSTRHSLTIRHVPKTRKIPGWLKV